MEALGRAQREGPGSTPVMGLASPQIESLVKEYRRTGGPELSTGVLMRAIPLPDNDRK